MFQVSYCSATFVSALAALSDIITHINYVATGLEEYLV